MAKKPIIAVTGPDAGGWVGWYAARVCIWMNGGRAVRVTPSRPIRVEEIQSLVIGGGADIHPSRYKQELMRTIQQESRRVSAINLRFLFSIFIWLARKLLSIPSTQTRNDLGRDDLEFSLLREATSRKIPVLGICRGGQLINVFFGGTLFQDIKSFYVESPKLRTMRALKLIQIESGTSLARIFCHNRAKVNSLHDQSVRDLGRDLRVSAREPNGVVQAIEHQFLPFVIGVQWHPEFLPLHREQRRLFYQLVQAAKVYAKLNPTAEASSDFALASRGDTTVVNGKYAN